MAIAQGVSFVTRMHEGFPVSLANLDACIAFYCDVFGLERVPRPKAIEEYVPGAWLVNREQGIEVHLFAREGERLPGPDAHRSPTARHTAWMVESLDALRAQLRAHGVPFEEMSSMIGASQLFVLDPEGHEWEFQERPS